MPFSTASFQERIEKPWGYEIIYTPASLDRTGKIIVVRAGAKLSLQYHDRKEETFCLIAGEAILWLENEHGEIVTQPMTPYGGYTISPNQKHRIEAVTDATIIEVSSPETGNTIRVSDEYQREHETELHRQQKNRGWNG